MTQRKPEQSPASPIGALDLEIADKVGRLSNGTATAEDISEATRLTRERVDRMMPNVFRRLKAERKALR
jgi:DNA-directed RNA polymerase sigma subunit (sigma70/sigma32)